jgi:hypothetical protein
MAASASDWVGISTKPNPRSSPVALSVMRLILVTSPEIDEQVLEFVLGDCERQIAYIDVHDILVILDRAQTDRAGVHKILGHMPRLAERRWRTTEIRNVAAPDCTA